MKDNRETIFLFLLVDMSVSGISSVASKDYMYIMYMYMYIMTTVVHTAKLLRPC